ncbi:hypothetical protein [Salinithrix halophila]|uniref:Uncharacterized protein n=1 Tax=Salinithrix halophila TaxID=1485204 RepID=A0ABV8JDN7_9BACL
MRLEDALFNWLQIRVVWNARPQDRSAEETTRFFYEILAEDHGVEELYVMMEKDRYTVRWQQKGQEQCREFEREQVEQLLRSIEAEPKYNKAFDCGPEREG